MQAWTVQTLLLLLLPPSLLPLLLPFLLVLRWLALVVPMAKAASWL